MIEVNDECTGCMACVQACPARALSVCHGEFSFYYPRLTGSCTECGKCKAVCPKGTGSTLFDPLVVYAGIHRSHHVLQNSSSGGFFHAAAESVISSGGAVYGCAWSSENKAEHIRVDRVSDLPRLQGSKYVQSFVGSAYIEARKDLDEGREVLFSGTPCQVAGLRSYLGKDHENLLTLDLVCHGVPSQRFLDSYLSWMEDRCGSRLQSVVFRDKGVNGWASIGSITCEGNPPHKEIIHPGNSYYYYLFDTGNVLRPSCYACKYATPKRIGDITIGDFWGVEKLIQVGAVAQVENGVSLIMVNTSAGKRMIDRVSRNMLLIEVEKNSALRENSRLSKPVPRCRFDPSLIRLSEQSDPAELHRLFKRRTGFHRLIQTVRIRCPKGLKYWVKRRI